MVYLYFDEWWVKILAFKKSLFSQEEVLFFNKKYETKLIEEKGISNIDLLASAIKEGFNLASPKVIEDKNVILILPQKFFSFFRVNVPIDINEDAVEIFIRDKAKELSIDVDNSTYSYFIKNEDNKKLIFFFGIENKFLEKINQLSTLLDIKVEGIIPEVLTYYKLFEKTLRKDKKEIIFYAIYEQDFLKGYLYDSFGLLDGYDWRQPISKENEAKGKLKEKIKEIEASNLKINRLILSGSKSEEVRQDTFTKEVGVWTNPLKRIMGEFYKDYLNKLVIKQKTSLPLLALDNCFGAFISYQEDKYLLPIKISKQKVSDISKSPRSITLPLIKKEGLIFFISFIASFIFFILISKQDLNFKKSFSFKTPSPTTQPKPTATATPTPAFTKEELKIKVLNGSGVVGKAGEMKSILREKGYNEIVTGNADNFDYQQTEIQVKKDKQQASEILKKDLKDYISTVKTKILDDKEVADVIIILGSDFK
ncbi:MAG: LytR C-terminal domain-containing protein [Microgenomates group bacterium]